MFNSYISCTNSAKFETSVAIILWEWESVTKNYRKPTFQSLGMVLRFEKRSSAGVLTQFKFSLPKFHWNRLGINQKLNVATVYNVFLDRDWKWVRQAWYALHRITRYWTSESESKDRLSCIISANKGVIGEMVFINRDQQKLEELSSCARKYNTVYSKGVR